MEDKRLTDATAAQFAARRHLEGMYPEKVKAIKFRKCWNHVGATADLWEVEGMVTVKRLLCFKTRKLFKYQLDARNGNVVGWEEISRD